MGSAIELDFLDLGWSLAIMAIAMVLSNWQRLGLEGQLFLATGRSLLQLLVVGYVIQPEAWYSPQYLIPLTGMILGNAMKSASLSGERLISTISHNQLEVETYLSLGATPKEAIASYRKEAIRVSLIPTLNQMMVVGMVSLPGMFTGQVLAGNNPLNAASYQILILFMIMLTNILTAILVTEGVYRRCFNEQAQLKKFIL